jgi:hypothetical protein
MPITSVALGKLALILAGLMGSAPLCALRRTLDVACPTCGFTRSIEHLVHGQLAQSFAAHPMGPGVLVEAACFAGFFISARWRGDRFEVRPGRWLILNAALFLAIWGIRAVTGTLPV